MPFTPAHVAAVIPFRGRRGLPFAALAAGSMAPDLAYFLPLGALIDRELTHSAISIPTWDLVFGLAMFASWRGVAPLLHDMSPGFIRSRWLLPTGPQPRWWQVGLAVLLGSVTHFVWDSLTHAGSWATTSGLLKATYTGPLGSWPGYMYAQYVSGVLGLLVVLWFGFRMPRVHPGPRSQPGLAIAAPVVALAAVALTVTVKVSRREYAYSFSGLQELVVVIAASSITGMMLAALLLCLAHSLMDSRPAPAAIPRRAMDPSENVSL